MNNATVEMIRGWVATDGAEGAARFMARTLRIGSLRVCRALVAEAMKEAK